MRKFSKSKPGNLHFFPKFTGDVVINYFEINYFELWLFKLFINSFLCPNLFKFNNEIKETISRKFGFYEQHIFILLQQIQQLTTFQLEL